jgi:hypothetical protein
MPKARKKPTQEHPAPSGQIARHGGDRSARKAFPGLMGSLARSNAESLFGAEQAVWAGETRCPAAQANLYRSLREAVPIIDAAIMRLVRLVGGFTVKCEDEGVQRRLHDCLEMISVGGTQRGMAAFVGSYFEQLLTFGTAIGELVLREDGEPAALWNVPLEGVTLRRAKNGLDVELCTGEAGNLRAAPRPELLCCSVLNPAPGALTGNSILKGLPFVSSVLLQIMDTIGLNWERLGNVRFAVTYHPGSDPNEQARAGERTKIIAEEWEKAMREGAALRDFIAAGDVRISVIGGDVPLPDSQVPVRQLLEQIVAKTGLPPFLLGLTWSSTERMSSVQADLLTSELESYRRTLTPIILQLCRSILTRWGEEPRCAVDWDDITLVDEVELARARLTRAQAARIELAIDNGQ